MTWVNTETITLTSLWSEDDRKNYRPHGGIGHHEWFNLETGAAYLLVTDGEWRTGGEYHLLFRASTHGPAVDVTTLLWPAGGRGFTADEANHRTVLKRLQKFIDTLLDAEKLG